MEERERYAKGVRWAVLAQNGADDLMIVTPAPPSAIEMHCLHGFVPTKMLFDNKLPRTHRKLCIECVGCTGRPVRYVVLGVI